MIKIKTIIGLILLFTAFPAWTQQSLPAKRIVVLEFSLLDDLLQLGVRPVGIASSRADEGTNPPFLLSQIQNIPDVGTRQQPNLEKIIALHPDLIVADTTMHADLYPLLKQIAPTLMLNGLLGSPDEQLKNIEVLAQATNQKTHVLGLKEKLQQAYTQAQKIGQQHPATVIIGYVSNAGEFQAITANALISTILKDFSHPNLITVFRKEQSVPLPIETIYSKNPDQIIILLTDGNKEPYERLIKNPLWSEITAVKAKHVYFMDRDLWAKNHGVLATQLMLKQAKQSGFLNNQSNKEIKEAI